MTTGSVMSGSAEVGAMVWPFCPPFVKSAGPVIAKLIVSVPEPAAHSPTAAPETASVFAEMIASRSVQAPSLAAISPLLLTDSVAAEARQRITPTQLWSSPPAPAGAS
ncbi:MAG: hypothetical protein U0526_02455 [Candidatus Saccharibacteria bacterium]